MHSSYSAINKSITCTLLITIVDGINDEVGIIS